MAALLAALVLAATADAQEVAVAASWYSPLGIDDLEGRLPASMEGRITISLSKRFAIEPFVTLGAGRHGPEGFYGVQIRQRIMRASSPDRMVFVTYGTAGYFSSSESVPPVIGQFGVGLRRQLLERVSLRPEVQLVTLHVVPIGARLVVGVSVDVAR